MSRTNKIFQSIPVKIPDRSGFDLGHEVLTTAKVGTVVPITHFEVLPGDTVSIGSLMKVTLPPMAVPFMGRIDAELTAAFIPFRLVWQGWQSFITQNNGINTSGHTANPINPSTPGLLPGLSDVPVSVPRIDFSTGSGSDSYLGPGTLMHYLGLKAVDIGSISSNIVENISALPALCYHKFCDDWIRDENNMLPFFPKVMTNPQYTDSGSQMRYTSPHFAPFFAGGRYTAGDLPYPVGVSRFSLAPDNYQTGFFDSSIGLGSLRQRCWAKDLFTTATTRPQAGAAASVTFDTSGDTGNITVSSLRFASALQRWLERNNIAGTDYGSQILAHFGVTPPDAVLNRSVLLGSVRTPVYVGSVENNSGNGLQGASGTKSPYGNTLGAAAGFGSAADKGSLCDSFSPHEHGIIMVFFTLIPHAYYSSGVDRELLHCAVGDFAWPEFAGIGDQVIMREELAMDGVGTFGYNQRYYEYKAKNDVITGLLNENGGLQVDDKSLSVYALQRGFIGSQQLGSQFLEIPTDYLDQVLGVSASIAGFGCMIDAYFDAKVLRVLPEYSLPRID